VRRPYPRRVGSVQQGFEKTGAWAASLASSASRTRVAVTDSGSEKTIQWDLPESSLSVAGVVFAR
jgi:hypothetical protein